LIETATGFQVIAAKASSFASLTANQAQVSRFGLASAKRNDPEKVFCIAMFDIKDQSSSKISGYVLGEYANLDVIHERTSVMNSRQAELIKFLNKES
jgi:hypothetical protein